MIVKQDIYVNNDEQQTSPGKYIAEQLYSELQLETTQFGHFDQKTPQYSGQ